MGNFILPVTIESRKIIFLDLAPQVHQLNSPQTEEFGEDEYIVEIPSLEKRTLLSISKSKIIQSLIKNKPDFPISKLDVSFNYDHELRVLNVSLSDRPSSNTELLNKSCDFVTGLTFGIEGNDSSFSLIAEKNPLYTKSDLDNFRVCFSFKIEGDDFTYYSQIKIYLVNKFEIRFAGLDFGSEASQMREGKYNFVNTSSVESQSVNLFKAIKRCWNAENNDKSDDFVQFEENNNLYKSIFYVNKTVVSDNNTNSPLKKLGVFSFPDSLNVMTKKGDQAANFFDDKVQIPNLKIIHGAPDFANNIPFKNKINEAQTLETNLAELKHSIYAGLLQKMIQAYIQNNINESVYLRFSLLIPNIYTIQEIIHAKKVVRCIINELNSKNKGYIKGLEISSLSESDASFLGCLQNIEIKPNRYFIIIDCGKGTTDYSIIQSEKENKNIFKPVYRDGFAGAGNLISFAFLQSILYFLQNLYKDDPLYQSNVRAYLKKKFISGEQTWFKNDVYNRIEIWKKNYSVKNKEEIENEWLNAKAGNRNLQAFFQSEPSGDKDFIELLDDKITQIYDWGGYVENAVADIVTRVSTNLIPAIRFQNKRRNSHCGGILFTGRGFLFTPLQNAMLSKIQSLDGMANAPLLNNDSINPKEVCMQGVFEHNIISYSDIASTPIEIDIKSLDKMKKSTLEKKSYSINFERIRKWARFQFLNDEGENYNDELNQLKVINYDLMNCRFHASGKIYQPERHDNGEIKNAQLIQCRSGLFLRLTYENDTDEVVPLIEANNVSGRTTKDKNNVLKSLFPGWLDNSLLEELNLNL